MAKEGGDQITASNPKTTNQALAMAVRLKDTNMVLTTVGGLRGATR